MASYTGNLGLKKPALDDDALITDINNNMDILDAAVNGIQDGLAIVANGNTHVAITSGQFVYVRNHGTLTEGLYVASSNIAANATLSTSNLTADAAGGLNALNSKVKTDVVTTRDGNGVFLFVNQNFLSSGKVTCTLISKQLTLCVEGISTKNTSDWIGKLWQEFKPEGNADYYFPYYLGNEIKRGYVQYDGYIFFEELNTTDVINATIVINMP